MVNPLYAALAARCRIDRERGPGGMATVFLAQAPKHDRPVALKVPHPDLARVVGPDRFLREIRLSARLQHPHIVVVHDSGEVDGQLWYTMPFVAGGTLHDRLLRERQLPLQAPLPIPSYPPAPLHYPPPPAVTHPDLNPHTHPL